MLAAQGLYDDHTGLDCSRRWRIDPPLAFPRSRAGSPRR